MNTNQLIVGVSISPEKGENEFGNSCFLYAVFLLAASGSPLPYCPRVPNLSPLVSLTACRVGLLVHFPLGRDVTLVSALSSQPAILGLFCPLEPQEGRWGLGFSSHAEHRNSNEV